MALLRACAVFGCATLLLMGCSNIRPIRSADFGTSVMGLATTAEYRLVTERTGPFGTKVVCTEPSPDVAMAISAALNASVSYSGASGALGYQSNEAIAQLGKRYATVQLLRDMMYRDCELYGNGIISKVEYAMKLSRFDSMVVTLLGIEMVSGDSASAPPQSPDKSGDPSAGISKAIDDTLKVKQDSDKAVENVEPSVKEADTKVSTIAPPIPAEATNAKAAFDAATYAIVQAQSKVDAAIAQAVIANAKGKDYTTATTAITEASTAGDLVKPKAALIIDADATAKKAAAAANIQAPPKTAIADANKAIAEASNKLTTTISELVKILVAIKGAGNSPPSGNPSTAKGSTVSNALAGAVQAMQHDFITMQGLGPVTVACAMALDGEHDRSIGNNSIGREAIRSGIVSLTADLTVTSKSKDLFTNGRKVIEDSLKLVTDGPIHTILENGLSLIDTGLGTEKDDKDTVKMKKKLTQGDVNFINAGLRLLDDQQNSAWFDFCQAHMYESAFWQSGSQKKQVDQPSMEPGEAGSQKMQRDQSSVKPGPPPGEPGSQKKQEDQSSMEPGSTKEYAPKPRDR